ncbi:MAG: hypothetical protein ACFFCS_29035 [Candidatus Hodarchaeota archaeon]
MNPSQIAELLNNEDIVFFKDELVRIENNKKDIAGKLGIERGTMYKLETYKDISLKTKIKFVNYFLLNDRENLHEYLQNKLEIVLSELILDAITYKSKKMKDGGEPGKRGEIAEQINSMIGVHDALLRKHCLERYLAFLSWFSKQVNDE